ncbi:MAG TPA: hypothetical protein PK217_01660, partial [Sphingopyxis terrae]|nr:hypothetical protein [Sphingopyxis terrae]
MKARASGSVGVIERQIAAIWSVARGAWFPGIMPAPEYLCRRRGRRGAQPAQQLLRPDASFGVAACYCLVGVRDAAALPRVRCFIRAPQEGLAMIRFRTLFPAPLIALLVGAFLTLIALVLVTGGLWL